MDLILTAEQHAALANDTLRGLYEKQADGTYHLKLNDPTYAGLKSKVDEFRNNNVALTKRQQELEATVLKYKDIDPERARKALGELEKIDKMEEATLLKEGKLDEVVQKRTSAMSAEFQRQIQAKDAAIRELTEKSSKIQGRLGQVLIEQTATSTLGKFGKIRQGAVPDIIGRARSIWQLDESGNPVALKAPGEKAYGKDGNPLTFEEWAQNLINDAPHLFESGTGGGAGGSGGGGEGKGGVRTVPNTPENMGKFAAEIASGAVTLVPA